MNRISIFKSHFLLACCLFIVAGNQCFAQEEEEAAKPVIRLQYFNNNGKQQYLLLESQLKKNKLFTPQVNKTYNLYLDSADQSLLIANLKTDEGGKASTYIPPALKEKWENSASHVFILREGEEELISDFTINKARIQLDTANTDGVRSVRATVTKLEGDEWVPVPDVEMKIGIERMGGILSAGEEDMYTTDSTGTVSVDLNKLDMPGDAKGNYILAARVEDHETLGNLLYQQIVPWGKKTIAATGFFEQRTLWSTRFRTPYWLLLMAYSIIIAVWGSLIFLMFQLIKIKRLGGEKIELQKATLPGPSVRGLGT